MKKEKKRVAKLEKKAKVDNRDVNGNTNEFKLNNTIENENEETSKKKKGRPKKSSNDLFETIYPKLSLKLSDEEIEKLKGKDRIIAKIFSKSENPKELKKKLKKYKKQIEELEQPKELLNSDELLTKAVYEAEKEKNQPYLEWIEIKLKNLTDEKLKNVLLFDHHDEFKGMVEYSSSTFSLGMKEFLRQLSSIQKGKYAIRFFRYNAFCDLQRFADKQTNAYITASFTNLSGTSYSIPYRPDHLKDHSTNRYIKSIADVTTNSDLSFCSNLSLRLDYLMPETEISIHIVVEKLEK